MGKSLLALKLNNFDKIYLIDLNTFDLKYILQD